MRHEINLSYVIGLNNRKDCLTDYTTFFARQYFCLRSYA